MADGVHSPVALVAAGVRADTTAGNAAALGVLRSSGFRLAPGDEAHAVRALLLFAPAVPGGEPR